jgi:hypothetical protein
MRQAASTVVAFLCAPLIPALYFATTNYSWGHEEFARFGLWLVLAYGLIGFYVLLLGLPAYLVARHFGLVNFGTILGTALLVAIAMSSLSFHGASTFTDIPGNAIHGAISAFVFWRIWQTGSRQDDRK